jgi:hypothetical protein
MPSPDLKLKIDLIAETAWGSSLSKVMSRHFWRKLREQMIEERGRYCHTCGNEEILTCHEEWEFQDETGKQVLTGFSPICRMCHFVVHIGMSQHLARQGSVTLDDVIDHFCKVNSVGTTEFEAHKHEAFEVYRKRSKREWEIDYGKYADLLAGFGADTDGNPLNSPHRPKIRIRRPKSD